MGFLYRAASLAVCVIAVTGAASAECWKLPNGQIVETMGNSTPPVAKAKKVTCPKPSLRDPTPSRPIASGPPLLSIAGRYPLGGAVTQEYGVAWSEKSWKTHTGVDISASGGTPVPAMADGTVAEVRDLGGDWGRAVIVEERGGAARGYLHVDPSVKRGDKVLRGQEVGKVRKDHLHYNVCRGVALCHLGALPTNEKDPEYPNHPLFKDGPFKKP
jgi:murein DD-endopeptidase MepM/ murein hydrolase activator NlpD